MKILFVTFAFLFSFNCHAEVVDGKVAYTTSTGELVERQVSLEVPSRGVGEVVLLGENFEWRTKKFWSKTSRGATKFYASFKTEFMGKKSTILFKGTYIKGTNTILYYGDFYKRKGHLEVVQLNPLFGFEFEGAFKFKYDR